MTNRIREQIQLMPLSNIRQIILDWENLDSTGSIGNCFLRSTAKEYIGDLSISIVSAMRDFAFEAYRFIARFYGSDFLKEEVTDANEQS